MNMDKAKAVTPTVRSKNSSSLSSRCVSYWAACFLVMRPKPAFFMPKDTKSTSAWLAKSSSAFWILPAS